MESSYHNRDVSKFKFEVSETEPWRVPHTRLVVTVWHPEDMSDEEREKEREAAHLRGELIKHRATYRPA